MLGLYARFGDPLLRREIGGIRAVTTKLVIGAYPQPGPRTFVCGLEVRLQLEEQAFAQGALTLASVMSGLFTKHANANSFTHTIFHTVERGEICRLPALLGARHLP